MYYFVFPCNPARYNILSYRFSLYGYWLYYATPFWPVRFCGRNQLITLWGSFTILIFFLPLNPLFIFNLHNFSCNDVLLWVFIGFILFELSGLPIAGYLFSSIFSRQLNWHFDWFLFIVSRSLVQWSALPLITFLNSFSILLPPLELRV